MAFDAAPAAKTAVAAATREAVACPRVPAHAGLERLVGVMARAVVGFGVGAAILQRRAGIRLADNADGQHDYG